MTRPAPPAAWAIAAVLVSPLFYTSAELAVVAAHGSSWSTDEEVTRRIDDYFTLAAPPATQRGVMLGISGGLCTFAGAPADGAVRVLPISAGGQGFHELYPYLDQVIAHRPDFILVQGTALVTASEPPTAYQVARRRLRQRLLAPLLGVDGHTVEGAVAGAERDACRVHELAREGWAAELVEDVRWVTVDEGAHARQQLLAAVDRLIASTIPVFVFEQPRNDYSVDYLRTVERQVDALLRPLGDRRAGLTMLSYQDIMAAEMFYDSVHLRPEGGDVFRERLLKDVVASLAARTSSR